MTDNQWLVTNFAVFAFICNHHLYIKILILTILSQRCLPHISRSNLGVCLTNLFRLVHGTGALHVCHSNYQIDFPNYASLGIEVQVFYKLNHPNFTFLLIFNKFIGIGIGSVGGQGINLLNFAFSLF